MVVVVPSEWIDIARDALGRDVDLVIGGETRQASVYNGLARIDTSVVVVHDAARPLVDAMLVESVVRALDNADGAIPVVPVGETIKEVAEERVVRTIDRSRLTLAQTPQAFRTDVLRMAHEKARADGHTGTDDAELVERVGGTVAVVPGSARNIKLTFPEDFALAEALMST